MEEIEARLQPHFRSWEAHASAVGYVKALLGHGAGKIEYARVGDFLSPTKSNPRSFVSVPGYVNPRGRGTA